MRGSADRNTRCSVWSSSRRTGSATPSWRCRRSRSPPRSPARAHRGRRAAGGRAAVPLVPEVDERSSSAPRVAGTRRDWRVAGAESRPPVRHRAAAAELVSRRAARARAGIPERWGYRADCAAAADARDCAADGGVHQADYYQRWSRRSALRPVRASRGSRVSAAARSAADRLLTGAGWNGRTPLVALAPGAAYGGAKRWPPERVRGAGRGAGRRRRRVGAGRQRGRCARPARTSSIAAHAVRATGSST